MWSGRVCVGARVCEWSGCGCGDLTSIDCSLPLVTLDRCKCEADNSKQYLYSKSLTVFFNLVTELINRPAT